MKTTPFAETERPDELSSLIGHLLLHPPSYCIMKAALDLIIDRTVQSVLARIAVEGSQP
jgi:hypothetical protein